MSVSLYWTECLAPLRLLSDEPAAFDTRLRYLARLFHCRRRLSSRAVCRSGREDTFSCRLLLATAVPGFPAAPNLRSLWPEHLAPCAFGRTDHGRYGCGGLCRRKVPSAGWPLYARFHDGGYVFERRELRSAGGEIR